MIGKAIKAGLQAARNQIDTRYESARRRTRDRHYIEWRRNSQGAPAGHAPTIADRPSIFAVLIEAWRSARFEKGRARRLENEIRRIINEIGIEGGNMQAPIATPDFRLGFKAAVRATSERLRSLLSVE